MVPTVESRYKELCVETAVICLQNPKFIQNVAQIKRIAACFGIEHILFTGSRVNIDPSKERLPRELRMREYNEVNLYNTDKPFDCFPAHQIVCVENIDRAEQLQDFVHPYDAIYLFGPEDGSVNKAFRCCAHRFVRIPTLHSANLSSAVSIVLWDRYLKKIPKTGVTCYEFYETL